MARARRRQQHSFLHEHSLSLTTAAILLAWIALYARSDPHTHLGAFFGNAAADWTGVLVMVVTTKYFFETGSAESRRPPKHFLHSIRNVLIDHSLSVFLVVTGAGWIALYAAMGADDKWGQVVGNIVSEWTQILGLVVLTKGLIERGSKESAR